MRPKRDLKWRQLCAITAEQLYSPAVPLSSTNPQVLDWFEWGERIKWRIAPLWHYPPPHVITAAMEAVERVWRKRGGRLPSTTAPRRLERANVDPPWPRHRTLASDSTATWTSVSTVATGMLTRPAMRSDG